MIAGGPQGSMLGPAAKHLSCSCAGSQRKALPRTAPGLGQAWGSLADEAHPLQVAVVTGTPEMALSTLASRVGQAWGGVQCCLFEPSLGTPWVREACSCPTGRVWREAMGRGWTPMPLPGFFMVFGVGKGWLKSLQIP